MDEDKENKTQQPQIHQHHHRHHHRRHKTHVWRWVGVAFIMVLLVAGVGAYQVYSTLHSTADHTFIPLSHQKQSDSSLSNGKPISILLMGTDTGAEGRTEINGRSDTMIIATLNPDKKTTTMTSIPRDTMAKMRSTEGTDGVNIQKINAAYSIGGANMAVSTTSALLGAPINYYAAINMGGLEKIVNALGGVDISPLLSFTNEGYSFTKNRITHMNGKRALAYIQMRYKDPNGDYGRQTRERQVITAIIKAAPSLKNLTKFEQLMSQVQSNFRTNLSFDDMIALYRKYKAAGQNIKQSHLQGVGTNLKGSSYQIAPTKELQRVSNLINGSLDLPTKKLNNEETKQNMLNPNFDWNDGNSKIGYTVHGADEVN